MVLVLVRDVGGVGFVLLRIPRLVVVVVNAPSHRLLVRQQGSVWW